MRSAFREQSVFFGPRAALAGMAISGSWTRNWLSRRGGSFDAEELSKVRRPQRRIDREPQSRDR